MRLIIKIFSLFLVLLTGLTTAVHAQINYTEFYFQTAAGISGLAGFQDETAIDAYDALFHDPGGLTTDTNGNVFVADTYNGAVRKLTANGTNWVVTTIATNFSYPYAVAVGPWGVLYVADTLNNAIRKLTPSPTNYTLTTVEGTFPVVTGIAVDAGTNIYADEDMAQIIVKISPAGAVTTLAGNANIAGSNDGMGTAAHFNYPNGIAVDAAENVYVADSGNHTIRKITSNGVVTTLAGYAGKAGFKDGTGTNAFFDSPQGVAVDALTNVYVADYINNTIRKISPAGVVTTLAGVPGVYGSSSGAGSVARFYFPEDVAVDGHGNIFVADQLNDTIREGFITPPFFISGSHSLAGNHLGYRLGGLSGQTVIVQSSADLVAWRPVATNVFQNSTSQFIDPAVIAGQKRFYRAYIP